MGLIPVGTQIFSLSHAECRADLRSLFTFHYRAWQHMNRNLVKNELTGAVDSTIVGFLERAATVANAASTSFTQVSLGTL